MCFPWLLPATEKEPLIKFETVSLDSRLLQDMSCGQNGSRNLSDPQNPTYRIYSSGVVHKRRTKQWPLQQGKTFAMVFGAIITARSRHRRKTICTKCTVTNVNMIAFSSLGILQLLASSKMINPLFPGESGFLHKNKVVNHRFVVQHLWVPSYPSSKTAIHLYLSSYFSSFFFYF